jgi:hypothetical protein
LHEIEARAVSNPLWYQLSINIEGQRATDRARLRALFDSGVRWAPKYLPLYRTMMRMLMPRWSGSYALVDKFVDDMTNRPEGRDEALYAQLYSTGVMTRSSGTISSSSTIPERSGQS